MTELTSLIDFLDPPEQRSIRFAHLHGRNLKQREIDRFADLGVNALALASPWPVLADRVVFGGKSFHFARDTDEQGEMAFTIGGTELRRVHGHRRLASPNGAPGDLAGQWFCTR